jgi:hypothetical protein
VKLLRRTIRDLERNEKNYLAKARRAKQLGDTSQYDFLKQTIKRTASQRLLIERQLLNVETARQLKQQAEAHAQFASAMSAISKGIGEFFGRTDLKRTQEEFNRALEQAETMERRMEVFLDMTGEAMGASAEDSEVISDEEIERMVDAEIASEESPELDAEIKKGLSDIRRELGDQ